MNPNEAEIWDTIVVGLTQDLEQRVCWKSMRLVVLCHGAVADMASREL
jgi:hypothetical protein